MRACVEGVFVSERGRRRRGEGGGHSVLFLIDQQLLSLVRRERERERERERKREAVWREAVRVLSVWVNPQPSGSQG